MNTLVSCSLTLCQSGSIDCAIGGHFTDARHFEFALGRGGELELVQVDLGSGKVRSVCRTPVFAIIHSVRVVRGGVAGRDRLVVSSDSGHLSIVEYDQQSEDWKIVSVSGNFGRSGCRKNVPGQYLVCDASESRAVLVASVENEKLLFLLQPDGTFSSDAPIALPVPQSSGSPDANFVIFGACAVHLPSTSSAAALLAFAVLEATASSGKILTVYEIDVQGKNINTHSTAVSATANIVAAVPSKPGHILVGSEGAVSCYAISLGPSPKLVLTGTVNVMANVGRGESSGLLITALLALPGASASTALVLAQAENGHVVTAEMDAGGSLQAVSKLVLPVSIGPCTSIAMCHGGAAAEEGGVLLCAGEHTSHDFFHLSGPRQAPTLRLLDSLPNHGPSTDMLVDDVIGQNSPQVLLLGGRGSSARLRILTPGCLADDFATTSLPVRWGKPTGMFSLRRAQDAVKVDGGVDAFILISYPSMTVVLEVGNEVTQCRPGEAGVPAFETAYRTLGAIMLADGAILQIHTRGLRHIQSADGPPSDWPAPEMKQVERCCYNQSQVLLALTGGELVYFEVNANAAEGEPPIVEQGTVDLGKEVTSMDLGDVHEGSGRHTNAFAAVAFWDDTLQIISLASQDQLAMRANSSFLSKPESVCMQYTAVGGGSSATVNIALYVGLGNGDLIKMAVHSMTGVLSVSKQFVVAVRAPTPVSLIRVRLPPLSEGSAALDGVLACSSRTILLYSLPATSAHPFGEEVDCMVPLRRLDAVCRISTPTHSHGLAYIYRGKFAFCELKNLREAFQESDVPLKYTPRKMSRAPGTSLVAVVETDQCLQASGGGASSSGSSSGSRRGGSNTSTAMDVVDASHGNSDRGESQLFSRSAPGKWSSCLRVVNVATRSTEALVDFSNNKAAFSVAALNFSDKNVVVVNKDGAADGGGGQGVAGGGAAAGSSTAYSTLSYVVVGAATGLAGPSFGSGSSYSLETYSMQDGKLTFVHTTEIEDVPLAMIAFQDKLLVGIGRCLRLYDLGRKKLLRKCEVRGFPTHIMRLTARGDRVFVGDATNSVTFVKYSLMDNTLRIFAEENRHPRYVCFLSAARG